MDNRQYLVIMSIINILLLTSIIEYYIIKLLSQVLICKQKKKNINICIMNNIVYLYKWKFVNNYENISMR